MESIRKMKNKDIRTYVAKWIRKYTKIALLIP